MTIASTAERVVDSTSHFIERNKLAVRLTLTAVVASAVTASTILTYQASQRRKRSKALKEQLLQEAHTLQHSELTPLGTIAASNDSLSTGAQQVDFDESLIQEQLARNIAFLGEEGVQKVRQSLVVVVGAGSVGSWAALMLLRSGVQHLRIIDPRRLTGNNMAQHAVANVEDIGQYKVKALERHFREIAPFSRVVACTDRLTLMNMDALLGGQPAYVVDTMTHLDEKIALAQYCHQHNIKLISCMSVGAKADPTRIQISDISDSFGDPLTRAYRRRLKMLKIDRGIPVAHSIEKPNVPEGDDLGDFRTRRLPILGPIPSMLGMSIATYIILDLAEFSAMPAIPTRIRDNLYNRIIHDVTERETKVYKNKACPLDIHDAIYIFEEIWQAKSVLSGPQDRLTLTRWDRSKPMSYLNAVCMSRDEARAHDALPPDTDLREHYGDDVVDFVNKQFEQEEYFQKLWK